VRVRVYTVPSPPQHRQSIHKGLSLVVEQTKDMMRQVGATGFVLFLFFGFCFVFGFVLVLVFVYLFVFFFLITLSTTYQASTCVISRNI